MLGYAPTDADGSLVIPRALNRLAREESGQTLLELLIVAVILSILLLVAVPSYLAFRDNAYKTTAKSNVKNLSLTAGLYGQAHSGYQGMTVAALKATYDAGLPATAYVNNSGREAAGVTVRAPLDATHYCVYSTAGRWFAYQLNPTGQLVTTTVAAAVCT